MSEQSFGVVSLTIILILFIYGIAGSFFEHKHFHLIHETGIGIFLGMIAGAIFYYGLQGHREFIDEFNGEFFFYILLPIIIFSGGYNLNKRRFFQNFLYITLFGLVGTILTFIIILTLTWLINYYDLLYVWGRENISLSFKSMMIFSATICATDSVAALTMIKADKYPKLFSVLFGEGMVNDAVAIILFVSVDLIDHSSKSDGSSWIVVLELIGLFLLEFIGSFLIGLIFGLFASYLFKRFRFITESCILEIGIIIYMGYGSFALCELLELSGVISVLVTGIILAHYNFYNLSNLGQLSSRVSLQTLSLICEAFIYVYLGISIWNLKESNDGPQTGSGYYKFSWSFICLELIICFFSRGISMFILTELTQLIKGRKKFRLSFWELNIVWFAGLIRGSIAYALISKLSPENDTDEEQIQVEIIQNSVLIMVILTTIILGGLMPCYIQLNLKFHDKRNKNVADLPQESVVRQTLMSGDIMGRGESQEEKNFKGKVQRMMKRLDEYYLKPWFIYDYKNRKQELRLVKKLEKNQDDPVQPRRTTQLFRSMRQSALQVGQAQRETMGKRESSQYAKVAFRQTFTSKFAGNQEIVFAVDVPLNEDEIVEIDESKLQQYSRDQSAQELKTQIIGKQNENS